LLTCLNPTLDMILRIWAITKKELKQIRRDVRTLIIMFVFPIFMLVLFGYAVNFDVTSIKIGVYDREKSEISRQFVQSLQKSGYFDIVSYFDNQNEINKALDEKRVQSVIVIPDDLSKKFYNKEDAKIQYLIDGVDGNTATIIMNYLNAATLNLSGHYQNEVLARSGINIYSPVDLQPRFWFNPDLKSSQFLIPGLIGAILIILTVVLTAIAIVREKELGTIEQINVSPVNGIELLLGKIIPYILVSLFISVLILIAGHFIFEVQLKGNFLLLFCTVLLYLFACLNIGILVSTIADSQQVAFQMGMLFSMLPSMLLSGFIFPIQSMPKVLQILTNISPTKFFLVALRDILIKGAGIEAFWEQLVYLLIYALIFLLFASLRMKFQRAQ
jgi:ABC-2 type transport system permease protein